MKFIISAEHTNNRAIFSNYQEPKWKGRITRISVGQTVKQPDASINFCYVISGAIFFFRHFLAIADIAHGKRLVTEGEKSMQESDKV